MALALLFGTSAPAQAHGVWSHIHVTGWAAEALPPGELRDFLSEPEVFNALLFGAAFTDSGYWPQQGDLANASRTYSEHTHWEPFIQKFITWILTEDPPPWDDIMSRQRVGFMMGCAAHGLQDEIFDSLFLHQIDHHDHMSQDEADPGTDGFLSHGDYLSFFPEPWLPMETLLELYAELDPPITESVINDAVNLMIFLYVNEDTGPDSAEALYGSFGPSLPWTGAYFMDPAVPGSLASEVTPTAGYLQAIWDRLHGAYHGDATIVHTFPEPMGEILGVNPDTPDPWVTLIYGIGVHRDSLTVQWQITDDISIPFTTAATQWHAEFGRLHRLMPTESLTPATWFEVEVLPGLTRIDGQASETSHVFTFHSPCDPKDDTNCTTPPPPGQAPASQGCTTATAASGHLVWALLFFLLYGWRSRAGKWSMTAG